MKKHPHTSEDSHPVMQISDVVDFLDLCDKNRIDVWLDGGWGVDALLGEQTRKHEDLDIVVQKSDTDRLRSLVEARGFSDVPEYDSHPWVFMLADSRGHQIDFHVIELDSRGDGLYGPPDDQVKYSAEALSGMGQVSGRSVRCISAEWQVKFHAGYELGENDRQDLHSLCDRFKIPFPHNIPTQGTRWNPH